MRSVIMKPPTTLLVAATTGLVLDGGGLSPFPIPRPTGADRG